MKIKFERRKSVGWLINVLAIHLTKELDAELKKNGLSIALWPTLICLWEKEGISQCEIAKQSKVENSTTTRTLDKLESLGLVTRKENPNSRRSFCIFLTKKGRELMDTITPNLIELSKRNLVSINEDEKQELVRILSKLVNNIN